MPTNHEAAVGLGCSLTRTEPVTVLADSAYGSGVFRTELDERGHVDRVKPAPAGSSRMGSPLTTSPSTTKTAPPLARTDLPGRSTAVDAAVFGAACANCPMRARCTRARRGKYLKVGPHDARQRAARRAARDPQWVAEYRQHRPMIERTIAWLTRGNRRLRYRGTVKNDHISAPPSSGAQPPQAGQPRPSP